MRKGHAMDMDMTMNMSMNMNMDLVVAPGSW